MPFDVDPRYASALDDLTRDTSLKGVVASMGIIPIPLHELEAHKAAEVAKHPASRFTLEQVRKWSILCLGGGSALLGIGVAIDAAWRIQGPTASAPTLDAMLSTCAVIWGLTVLATLAATEITIKGPAEWREETYRHYLPARLVPKPIADLAVRIKRAVPDATFTVGTLHQESRVLDPYLLMSSGGETIALGVWDGDEVLRTAATS